MWVKNIHGGLVNMAHVGYVRVVDSATCEVIEAGRNGEGWVIPMSADALHEQLNQESSATTEVVKMLETLNKSIYDWAAATVG